MTCSWPAIKNLFLFWRSWTYQNFWYAWSQYTAKVTKAELRHIWCSIEMLGVIFDCCNQTVLVKGRHPSLRCWGMGPVLFTVYLRPLGHVIRHYNTSCHLSADVTQLHKRSSPKHFAKLLLDIQSCAESVRDWMVCNRLRMNDDKTEIMPVGTKARLKSFHKLVLWLILVLLNLFSFLFSQR